MAFQYYTDTPVQPYKLARVVAPASATSPAESWDFKTGRWSPAPGLAFRIFWSGEWEPLDQADVGEVQQKIKAFFAGIG